MVYTNTTGHPIALNVSTGTTTATTLYLRINGIVIYGSSYGSSTGQTAAVGVVPPNATYGAFLTAGTSNGFLYWAELR